MTWVFVVVAVLVVVGVCLVAIDRWDLGQAPEPDLRPELAEDPNFDVVLRGYRMDEVDRRISSMQGEIDRLSGRVAAEPEGMATPDGIAEPEGVTEPESVQSGETAIEPGALTVHDVRPVQGPKGWHEHSDATDLPIGSWREQ